MQGANVKPHCVAGGAGERSGSCYETDAGNPSERAVMGLISHHTNSTVALSHLRREQAIAPHPEPQ